MAVSQAILEDLALDAGYRPITITRFDDLIGGCRYVWIGPDKSVIQFTPNDFKSTWYIWEWKNGLASCVEMLKRSKIAEKYKYPDTPGYHWFGKVSGKICADLFYSKATSDIVPMGFPDFITAAISGYDAPYDMTEAFNTKHPVDPMTRAQANLKRMQMELDAREAAIRQKEAFSEMDEIKLIGAQYAQRGDVDTSQAYFSMAEEIRKRVQTCLDNKLPVQRYNLDVADFMNKYTFGFSGFKSAKSGSIQKESKKLETAQQVTKPTGIRSIILDDEI